MHGLRRALAHFKYISKVPGALKVSAVVPSKMFFTFNEHNHGVDPIRLVQALQAASQRLLYIRKIISALEGIASIARRAGDLAQLRARLTGAGRQVIAAFWHLARRAQSAGYFFGFFFIHNLIISYSLQPVKLGRLDPDSLWEGPPAWELEDLFFCFIFFFGRARLAARSAFNCLNVLNFMQAGR